MKSEKIAVIALIVIIAGALSAYLLMNYGADIFNSQPKPDADTIEIGDCINVNYTGRYASNNTVFDSSYAYVENKSGGVPLNIFVTLDPTQSPPEGYSLYSSSIIKGLMTRMVGLKNGTSYTLGPIPPEEAYGNKFMVYDTVNTTCFNQNIFSTNLSLNQTLELIETSSEYVKMKWINLPDGKFTMTSLLIHESIDMDDIDPSYEDIMTLCPQYSIWENATEIINITEEKAIIKVTPNKENNLTKKVEQIPLDILGEEYLFIFPDITTATYTNDTITITSPVQQGATYTYSGDNPYGGTITYELTVNSVSSGGVINISIFAVEFNQSMYFTTNQTISFNRTFEIPLIYNMSIEFLEQALPQFMADLDREGYSLHNLAGESLIFEVTIEELYKTSQEES